jgi:hypothetical protein
VDRPPVVVPRDKLFLGFTPDGSEPVLLGRDDLVTHGVILGRTGSGKTGLGAVLVEELALSGVPVIVVDPKGDMTNLALAFPRLDPADFAPWVDAERDPTEEAAKWRAGLGASGQPQGRVRAYREAAAVTVYAPGWVRGEGVPKVDVLPSLRPPRGLPEEARSEQARGLVSALLGAVGVETDATDARHVLLTECVVHRWARGHDATLDGITSDLQSPPFATVGPMAVDRFLPPAEREKLARSLVALVRSATRWLGGTPLDMQLLLAPLPGGRARTSIFTLSHLEQDERAFFLTLLFESLLSWVREQPGTSRLKALLLVEECRGMLPPHPGSPATKAPLSRLLAQARAFGLGVVLSTQHPVDLDYKALSNVGTWLLGALRERDLQRDLAAELRERGVDETKLAALPARHFLACTKGGATATLSCRWALSYLRGPVAPGELAKLVALCDPPPAASKAAPSARVAEPEPEPAPVRSREPEPVRAREPEPRARPAAPQTPQTPAGVLVLGPAVPTEGPAAPGEDPWEGLSLPIRATTLQAPNAPAGAHLRSGVFSGATVWRASYYARLHLTFTRPRLPQAAEVDVMFALPLDGGALDWSRARRLHPDRFRQGVPTGWQKFEAPPPEALLFKAWNQVKKELDGWATEQLAWSVSAGGGPEPAGGATKRVAAALGLGSSDLPRAVLEQLLGAGSPLSASPDPGWSPPPDASRRLDRLLEALTGAAAEPAQAADLLRRPMLRVDEVGLLWTPHRG